VLAATRAAAVAGAEAPPARAATAGAGVVAGSGGGDGSALAAGCLQRGWAARREIVGHQSRRMRMSCLSRQSPLDERSAFYRRMMVS
jgi:hypothetical protein